MSNAIPAKVPPANTAWELTHPGQPKPVSGEGFGGASVVIADAEREDQYGNGTRGIGGRGNVEAWDNLWNPPSPFRTGFPPFPLDFSIVPSSSSLGLSQEQWIRGGVFASVTVTVGTAVITYGPWVLRGALLLLAL